MTIVSTDTSEASDLEATRNRAFLITFFRQLQKHVLVDDPGLYLFALAVAVSTFAEGDPLWGMIVGAPSGGKTSALQPAKGIADEHVDTLTAPALIHWHQKAKNASPVARGILVRIAERGFITIADFSTVLDARNTREEVFALLRVVYDGEVHRDLANGDGSQLGWKGRLTLLACCTSAIDNQSTYANALGPRWVYYRLPGRDKKMKQSIMKMARGSDKRYPSRTLAAKLAESLVVRAAVALDGIELSEWAAEAVEEVAYVAAQGRGSVTRDSSFKREIEGIPEAEEPTRLAIQLTLLALCLLAVGLTEREAVALSGRVGLGSMSSVRAQSLREVSGADGTATSASIAKKIGSDWKTVNRALEELECLGMVEHVESRADEWSQAAGHEVGRSRPWGLTEDHAGTVKRVMEDGMARSSRSSCSGVGQSVGNNPWFLIGNALLPAGSRGIKTLSNG